MTVFRIVDGEAVEITAEEAAEIAASAPVPPPRRAIAKTTIVRRLADAEIAPFEAALAAAPPRLRLLWREAAEVWVDEVEPFFVQAVGAARAAELLAP